MPTAAATRLLIRTTGLDDRVLAFGDDLEAASGHPVAYVVDERSGPIDARGRTIVGITVDRCRRLGLWCPPDFAWKCGDYGYYLARAALPDAERFWLIEYDVRFSGDDLPAFFRFFDERPAVDFLAPHFAVADLAWWWTATAKSRDATPYRCLFPVTRMSARAIDAARTKRAEQSRRLSRRLAWPNDEAFVATTVANAGFDCRDFNDFGRTFYSADSFTYRTPIDGDTFPLPRDVTWMYHPVLYGDAYRNKVARLADEAPPPYWEGLVRRWAARFNRALRW